MLKQLDITDAKLQIKKAPKDNEIDVEKIIEKSQDAIQKINAIQKQNQSFVPAETMSNMHSSSFIKPVN